ncbi:MAG: hypothetical protein HC769_21830, partial [Cyanobacteria bacterium CRU_2_1]|nr:hypothetical protein [Cyanobacteria bacterium CRU_2_1]
RSRHRRKSHPSPSPPSPTPSIFSSLIRCTVQDTGIGIDPDQSDRLFDLYTRGSRARYMPGLGLGLYLCRQIIAAHGGEIGVNSRPGEGATFWFTLPVYEDSATLEPT